MIARWMRILSTLALLVALAVPGTLEAQQRGQRRGPPQGRAELEQRVRQRFGQMIQEGLGLEAEEAARLEEVMRSFMGERMQLGRDEEATRRRVEALMLEGGEDEEEAGELVGRLMELREQEVALFRREQEALLEVLTPLQLLQFHAMREQLNERVRALRGQGGPGRRPGGGGPGNGLLPRGEIPSGGIPLIL